MNRMFGLAAADVETPKAQRTLRKRVFIVNTS
jgi:hypothetical protein